MKWEWRKQEKALYLPGKAPEIIEVPKLCFVEVHGQGDPNGPAFSRDVETLYALSYALRMGPKNGYTPPGYFEYTVYPLEGLWTLAAPWEAGTPLPKDQLVYRLMIRQPDFCTPEVFDQMLALAQKKLERAQLAAARRVELEEGLCAQIMHQGPYDEEPESFAKIDALLSEQGLRRKGHVHREIYLSDPRKTAPEKMRTVLRVPCEKEE